MPSGYQRGSLIVVLAIVLAGGLTLAWILASGPSTATAAQDLGEGTPLGSFALGERSGRAVTDATLADRVWIGSFIFTRCKLSCPRITSVMKGLQDKLKGSSVQLVSISVDPDHDTPDVLRDYADKFGADPFRWWFLTGDRDAILAMIVEKFHLTAMPNPAPAPDGSDEAVIHSDRLALVERGRVVGLFDSNDPAALEALISRAKRAAAPAWVLSLPAVNATLNGLSTILLLVGWAAIRRPANPAAVAATENRAGTGSRFSDRISMLLRNPSVRGHLLAMGTALLTSAAFLACYLVYHFFIISKKFPAGGILRWTYLTILTSHTLLATFFVVPLVLVTVFRALRGEYDRHASVARIAFPIWLYVSVTGVVIYLLLYQTPLPSAS